MQTKQKHNQPAGDSNAHKIELLSGVVIVSILIGAFALFSGQTGTTDVAQESPLDEIVSSFGSPGLPSAKSLLSSDLLSESPIAKYDGPYPTSSGFASCLNSGKPYSFTPGRVVATYDRNFQLTQTKVEVLQDIGSVLGYAVVRRPSQIGWQWDATRGVYTFHTYPGDEAFWRCYLLTETKFFQDFLKTVDFADVKNSATNTQNNNSNNPAVTTNTASNTGTSTGATNATNTQDNSNQSADTNDATTDTADTSSANTAADSNENDNNNQSAATDAQDTGDQSAATHAAAADAANTTSADAYDASADSAATTQDISVLTGILEQAVKTGDPSLCAGITSSAGLQSECQKNASNISAVLRAISEKNAAHCANITGQPELTQYCQQNSNK